MSFYKMLKAFGWMLLLPFVTSVSWQFVGALFATTMFVVPLILVCLAGLSFAEKRAWPGITAMGASFFLLIEAAYPNFSLTHYIIIVGIPVYGLLGARAALKFVTKPIFEQIGW